MDVWIGGVGDAFSLKHYGTHFIVREQGFHLLVDCPDGFRRGLAENPLALGTGRVTAADLDAVFITHLHGDHVNGLEMLLALRGLVLRSPLDIYTTPEVAAVLWERRLQVSLGQMYDGTEWSPTSLETFARLHVVEWEAPHSVGPFTLETRATRHHIKTAAMRLWTETDSESILSYSCDTAWDPDLVGWLFDGADAVFHETSHGPAHTPIERLEALDEAQRDRLWVVHYPDDLVHEDHPNLRFARQGELISL